MNAGGAMVDAVDGEAYAKQLRLGGKGQASVVSLFVTFRSTCTSPCTWGMMGMSCAQVGCSGRREPPAPTDQHHRLHLVLTSSLVP